MRRRKRRWPAAVAAVAAAEDKDEECTWIRIFDAGRRVVLRLSCLPQSPLPEMEGAPVPYLSPLYLSPLCSLQLHCDLSR